MKNIFRLVIMLLSMGGSIRINHAAAPEERQEHMRYSVGKLLSSYLLEPFVLEQARGSLSAQTMVTAQVSVALADSGINFDNVEIDRAKLSFFECIVGKSRSDEKQTHKIHLRYNVELTAPCGVVREVVRYFVIPCDSEVGELLLQHFDIFGVPLRDCCSNYLFEELIDDESFVQKDLGTFSENAVQLAMEYRWHNVEREMPEIPRLPLELLEGHAHFSQGWGLKLDWGFVKESRW